MEQGSLIEEIVCLNIDDLDIAELERRLEMVALLAGLDCITHCPPLCSTHCAVNGIGPGTGCPHLK